MNYRSDTESNSLEDRRVCVCVCACMRERESKRERETENSRSYNTTYLRTTSTNEGKR